MAKNEVTVNITANTTQFDRQLGTLADINEALAD